MGDDEMIIARRVRFANASAAAVGTLALALASALAPASASALPNPASVFCVKSGGKSEMRKGPRGVYGVCRLPDGRVVEEWTYFREMRGRAGTTR